MPSLTVLALLGSVLLAVYQLYYCDLWGSLRTVPGPFLTRITRLWELQSLRKGGFVYTNQALHQKYGPVVRLAPGRYSIDDPTTAKQIYGHGTKFCKANFYRAFGAPNPAEADIFSVRNSERHAIIKKQLTSFYSMTSLRSFEPAVDEISKEICERFSGLARDGTAVRIPDWMQYYAFDVIGQITFSESFGFIKSGEDHNGILGAIHSQIVYGAHVGLFAELHPWLAAVVSTLGMAIPIDTLKAWTEPRTDARRKGFHKDRSDARSDFLDKVLDAEQNGKVESLMAYMIPLGNVGAGSDTTGLSLSAVVWYLAKNVQASDKLRDEIRQFVSDGRISDPVTFIEAQSMPYLQAVIKEALRLHPAVGQIMARVVPKGGAEFHGYFFPEGTVLGANSWLLNYNKDVFGADADIFRPERWLEDKAQASRMEGNMYTFGAGSRTCIGKNISLLEMSKLIPQLYRHFDFELVAPMAERVIDSGWFVKQQFTCKIKALP